MMPQWAMIRILIAALAAMSPPPEYQVRSENRWSVVAAVDMSLGKMIWNEMGKAEHFSEKIVSAQLRLTKETAGINFNILVRNCTPNLYDYRQSFAIIRKNDVDQEVAVLEQEALPVLNAIEMKCSLPVGFGTAYLKGMEPIYRNLYKLNARMDGLGSD